MRRVRENRANGLLVIALVFVTVIAILSYPYGKIVGVDQQRAAYERQGGRYVEMTIDGYRYRGWLKGDN